MQTQPCIIPGDTTSHEGDPTYRAIQTGTRRQLVTALSIDLQKRDVYRVPTGKYGPKGGPFDILIIGDTVNGPDEIFVFPAVQTVHPGQEILVQLCCTDLPFFLLKGTPIAQAFLLPKNHKEQLPLNPIAMWAQVLGPNRPTIECGLSCKGEKIHRLGLLDSGADVSLLARSEWPANWELERVPGMISGIGGATVSMRSKHNVLVKGPEGKLATIRPFVVRAPITLWGRDVLSQWGASLQIPSWDF